MCEPSDEWHKLDESLAPEQRGISLDAGEQISEPAAHSGAFGAGEKDFSFPCRPSLSEDDDELTESKITAFLDEKVQFSVLSEN